jgi:ELWxxDGT repeat protein
LYFTADDGLGRALWRSDGTDDGTVKLKSFGDGGYSYGSDEDPSSLTAVGNQVFFTAGDDVHGQELWVSDGTRDGTVMVADVKPGRRPSEPLALTEMGGNLFFSARDGVHGRSLWKSDGTVEGTVMVKDVSVFGDSGYHHSLVAVRDTLFFVAERSDGQELWRSDGTEAGTVLVSSIDPTRSEYRPTWVGAGGLLFFLADDGVHGLELWTSNGTEAGTAMVDDLRAGSYDAEIRDLVEAGDHVYFTARDGTHGQELWRSDGTDVGTMLVKDISPDARSSGPSHLARSGDQLFFFMGADTSSEALWRSDGTAAGTVRVKDLNPTDEYGYGPDALTDVAGTLFLSADDGVHGHALWRSDGTEAGTVLVKDMHPDTGEYHYSYGPERLTAVGGTLFFMGDDGVRGEELWKSDGTEAGTVLVSDINRGGAFRVGGKPVANVRNGTLKATVRTEGAGRLEVGPARRPLIKDTSQRLRSAGSTTVTLRPTARGMRKLERALRQARREGRKVGKVQMSARFTFTPCGGEPSSQTRRFTFQLR